LIHSAGPREGRTVNVCRRDIAMHLILTIDLAGPGFQHGNVAQESARILHTVAERLITLHTRYGALDVENPELLYVEDRTGALAGYVSTIELDAISEAAKDRIAAMVGADVHCEPGAQADNTFGHR
jgi:hypothetical protein